MKYLFLLFFISSCTDPNLSHLRSTTNRNLSQNIKQRYVKNLTRNTKQRYVTCMSGGEITHVYDTSLCIGSCNESMHRSDICMELMHEKNMKDAYDEAKKYRARINKSI